MNFLTATITSITISAGAIAGCQPPADQFQPGIPVVENAPIANFPSGGTATAPAVRVACVVQAREGAIPNVDPPCRLNVYMSSATIYGFTPEQRCADMEGQLRYGDRLNCIDVAY